MAHIKLNNFHADFPIYNASSRSVKQRTMQFMTGGAIAKDSSQRTIVRALNDITLDIHEGERVALLGHNGAGKSTLLRVFSGVYAPTIGNIDIEGKIGSLIDINLGIDTESTGRQNIYMRGILLGLKKSDIDEKIDEIIEFSELGDYIDLPIRTYSSGMQMRLSFSIATALKSDILLMDEWLSVGDAHFHVKAEQKLKQIVNEAKIIIIATHSIQTALENCQRGILLEAGKVKADGAIQEVIDYWQN